MINNILKVFNTLFPIVMGVGSVILIYNQIKGWGWFLVISFLSFGLTIENEKSEEKEDEK